MKYGVEIICSNNTKEHKDKMNTFLNEVPIDIIDISHEIKSGGYTSSYISIITYELKENYEEN